MGDVLCYAEVSVKGRCGCGVSCYAVWYYVVIGFDERKNKMINFNAYVIELEEDTFYKVSIEDVCTSTVRNNGYFDDTVTTFESALVSVIELLLSNDYDYVETERGLSKKGRPCRKYVISVDNGD